MTPLQALSVDDIINQAHLRRWHQVKMNREQTLAEHQYLVAMLAGKILKDCGGPQSQIDATIAYALLHDFHETEMIGDLASNPLARRHADKTAGYDLSHAMQEGFWKPRIGMPLEAVNPTVHQLVGVADKLEALIHYILNGDPRTYRHRRIPEGLLDSVIKATTLLADGCQLLGIGGNDLRDWMRRELQSWVSRVGLCGPEFSSYIVNQIEIHLL